VRLLIVNTVLKYLFFLQLVSFLSVKFTCAVKCDGLSHKCKDRYKHMSTFKTVMRAWDYCYVWS
jgi:hypothetical protein